MTDWREIASAPRDGTWFCIARFDADGEHDGIEAGRYDPSMWFQYEQVGDNLYRKVERLVVQWTGFNNFHRATHWHPLKQAPHDSDHQTNSSAIVQSTTAHPNESDSNT